jgi:hypothetical protein
MLGSPISSISACVRGAACAGSEHAARTGGARLEHLVGIDDEVLAHRRHAQRREHRAASRKCSSAPSKRDGSVSTDTAAAPPRAYASMRPRRSWAGSCSAPAAGERSLISAMISNPTATSAAAARPVSAVRAPLEGAMLSRARLPRRRGPRSSAPFHPRKPLMRAAAPRPTPCARIARACEPVPRAAAVDRLPAGCDARGDRRAAAGDVAAPARTAARARAMRTAYRALRTRRASRRSSPRRRRPSDPPDSQAASRIRPDRCDPARHRARRHVEGRRTGRPGSPRPSPRAVHDPGALDRHAGQGIGHQLRVASS